MFYIETIQISVCSNLLILNSLAKILLHSGNYKLMLFRMFKNKCLTEKCIISLSTEL